MPYVVDRVLICDAFREPDRHYQLLAGGRSKLALGRRSSMRFLASARDVKGGIAGVVGKEASLFEDMLASTEQRNDFVNQPRDEVREWRETEHPPRRRKGSQGRGPRSGEGGNAMLPGEESALCNKDFGLLLDRGERLLGLALAMTGRGGVRMKEAELGFVAVVFGLYAKAVKTFRAIHLLCVHGLCEDAHALLRTLGEILANIKYLAKQDRESRANQFLDFTVIQDQKMFNATEQNPELRGMFAGAARGIVQQRVTDAKGRMPEDEFKRRYDAGAWHGRKIEEVMRDVGMQSAYDLVFRQGSRAIHATDLFDHMGWDPERGFVLKLLPGDKWAAVALSTSNVFFFDILNQVNAVANLGADDQIRSMLAEMMPAPSPQL